MTFSLRGLFALVCAALCAGAAAQHYPAKPIRLVVPFVPGGAIDRSARVFASALGEKLGGTVLVENRPGASGTIAIDAVAKAEPDGYTLLFASDSYVLARLTQKRVPFEFKDFVPLARVRSSSVYMAVNAKVPAQNLKELVALAKSKPGQLSYASGGTGTILHFAGEMFKQKTGTDIMHVPYKGSAPAIQDAVGGQVDIVFGGAAEMRPFLLTGQLKPIGMTGAAASPSMPMQRPFAQDGYPDLVITAWQGILAPAATPQQVVRLLTDASAEIADSPAFFKAIESTGAEPISVLKGDAFGAFIRKTADDYRVLVEQAKLTFEE
jgi:tripartite-type tricarboxylate transporter receptor subunit TctC